MQQASRGNSPRLIAAVDGGGTKAHCYVAELDETGTPAIVGEGTGGGCNPGTVGVDTAAREINVAVVNALRDSSSGDRTPDAALFAIAGTLHRSLAEELKQHPTISVLAQQVRVVPDLLPIVETANQQGTGVALICGTGSVAAICPPGEKLRVVGGWGPLLGDEGSCFAIGRSAIRHVLTLLEENQERDEVTAAVLAQLGAANAGEVKQVLRASLDPRSQIAATAAAVLKVASQGHPFANELILQAAIELASLVKRATLTIGEPKQPLVVAISGGGFRSALLRKELARALQAVDIDAQLILIADPTRACLEMAAREFNFDTRD